MTLIEAEPYILGYEYTRDVMKEPYRGDIDLFDQVVQEIAKSPSAVNSLELTNTYKWFYDTEPDIARCVPKQAREEIFFALRNGFIVPEVPAKLIFMIRKAYSLYTLPNLIFKVISDSDKKVFFQKGYLAGGYTIRDVICTFCLETYVPVGSRRLRVSHGSYSEVYIHETDMVAAVPNDIASLLSYNDIMQLTVDKNGIKLGGVYLRIVGKYYGACKSIYDLRTLI